VLSLRVEFPLVFFRDASYSHSCSLVAHRVISSVLSQRVKFYYVILGSAVFSPMFFRGHVVFSRVFFSGVLYSQIRSSAAPSFITRALLRHVVFSSALFRNVFRSAFLHDALNSHAYTFVAPCIPKCTPARRNYACSFSSCFCFLSGLLCLFYSDRFFLICVLVWPVILNDLSHFHALSLIVTFPLLETTLLLERSSC
jgi:hypothetical protein